MAIRTRQRWRSRTIMNLKTTGLLRMSRLLATVTGFDVQPNKAIVGRNAFAHEAGIHQDVVLKNAATYEIMTPESVGWTKNSLVLGKHSGRAAFRDKLNTLGTRWVTTNSTTHFANSRIWPIARRWCSTRISLPWSTTR